MCLVDRPVFSSSESQLSRRKQRNETTESPTCCNCFNRLKFDDKTSLQLSEVYCPSCSADTDNMACSLKKTGAYKKTLFDFESEIEYSKNFKKKISYVPKKEKKLAKIDNESEEIDFEYADDVLNNDCLDSPNSDDDIVKVGVIATGNEKKYIRVAGKEELPAQETRNKTLDVDNDKKSSSCKNKFINLKLKSKLKFRKSNVSEISISNNKTKGININKNKKDDPDNDKINNNNDGRGGVSTLPLPHKNKYRKTITVPKIQTADGTNIYFLCDLPAKEKKGSFVFLFNIFRF